jgi:hypothetical protein
MSKRSPSADEDDHDQYLLGYGFQATKSRKRSTDEDGGDRMKQANGARRRHAVHGANVYPLEYIGAPLLAEKFPLSANEKSFLEFTGTLDAKVARQYLNMTEGYLDTAVATYVDQEVPCAPPSTDQKLPAVRPAVLSTAAISSSTQLLWDDDKDGGDDDDNDDDDNSGLNDINGMSKYKLKRMRNVARNNARLASLGLLGRTPSPPPLPLTAPIERNVWCLKMMLKGGSNRNAM